MLTPGLMGQGGEGEPEGRPRLAADQLLRIRDEWAWDARNGIRSRAGQPPLSAAEVAVVFGLSRTHMHAILSRVATRRKRELACAAATAARPGQADLCEPQGPGARSQA